MKKITVPISSEIRDMIQARHFEEQALSTIIAQMAENGASEEALNKIIIRYTAAFTEKQILIDNIKLETQPEGALQVNIDFDQCAAVYDVQE